MTHSFFLDRTGTTPTAAPLWPAIVIPKEAIDAEIERLASLPRPANGRRRSLIVHPEQQAEPRARRRGSRWRSTCCCRASAPCPIARTRPR